MKTIYDFTAESITHEPLSLAAYHGKVVLIVNTASRCGFTPQYAGLQKLYETYGERGFVVLGFPCNQFLGQEPGSEEEIQAACELNFGVNFPLFAKVDVNGSSAHPLFRYLVDSVPGILGSRSIKWNFTKFLVDREGYPVRRYAPTVMPDALGADIERLLNQVPQATTLDSSSSQRA